MFLRIFCITFSKKLSTCLSHQNEIEFTERMSLQRKVLRNVLLGEVYRNEFEEKLWTLKLDISNLVELTYYNYVFGNVSKNLLAIVKQLNHVFIYTTFLSTFPTTDNYGCSLRGPSPNLAFFYLSTNISEIYTRYVKLN